MNFQCIVLSGTNTEPGIVLFEEEEQDKEISPLASTRLWYQKKEERWHLTSLGHRKIDQGVLAW